MRPISRRYSQKGDYIYPKPSCFDRFNQNRFKGDEPIWPELLGQQTFLNVTASSESFFDGRRVPSPSNVSSARPGSSGFFGRGEQSFFDQTLDRKSTRLNSSHGYISYAVFCLKKKKKKYK